MCIRDSCLLDVILLAKRNDIALPDVILRQTEKMAMADVAWLKPDHHIVMMGDSDDVDVRDRISVAAYLFLNPVLRFGGFDRLDYESIWDLGMKAGEEYAGMARRKPDFTSLFLEHKMCIRDRSCTLLTTSPMRICVFSFFPMVPAT